MYPTPVFKLSQYVHMFIKNIGDYLFDGILLLHVIRRFHLNSPIEIFYTCISRLKFMKGNLETVY